MEGVGAGAELNQYHKTIVGDRLMENYILEYHDKIQSGEIVTSNYIKSVYSILVKGLENADFYFCPYRASNAIMFIEMMCHHSEGRNDLLKLELWQKAMISAMIGIVDENGLRIFREVFVVVGRKNGKTLLASAIMAYMAYIDGEYGAKIFCLATKLDQASFVYEAFFQMIQKEDELSKEAKKRKDDIYIKETNTSIKPIAFNPKKSDGFNPHLVINDEMSSWSGIAWLRQYSVMKSALGARLQPMILSISTSGYENEGIYDELFARSTRFLNGGSDERRLLPFLYVIDDIDKWDDLTELRKSNPNMGVSVFEEYFKEQIAIAKNSLTEKAEYMMKYCNIKQSSATAWLEAHIVERAGKAGKDIKLSDFWRCYAVGGIDLSQSTDLTAASVIIQREGKLYAFTQFFMPAGRLEKAQQEDGVPYEIYVRRGLLTLSGENYIDYRDVYNWFMRLQKEHKIYIQKIGYDNYMAKYLIDTLSEQGFHTDYVKQGENLSPVIKEFEGILKDEDFIIADNPLLEIHFLNVALKQNLENRKVAPVKIDQRSRIDGFVSTICAMTVRQKYWDEIGIRLQNPRWRERQKGET